MAEAKVTLYLVTETDRAYHFGEAQNEGQGRTFWIPKSIVRCITKMPPQPGKWRECKLELPDWKAEQLDLEDES